MYKDFGKQTNQTQNVFSEFWLLQSSLSIRTKNVQKSKSCSYIYKYSIVNHSFLPGNTSFNPGSTSFGLGTTSFELGTISFDLGITSFRLGNTSFGLGNTSFGLGTTSFDLGTHILLSGRHLLRWGAHLFTRGLTFWLWGNIFPFKPGDCAGNCVVAGKVRITQKHSKMITCINNQFSFINN